MKKLLFIFLFTVLIFLAHSNAFALTTVSSNCVITNIGDKASSENLPINCQQSGEINSGSSPISRTALALVAAAAPCGNINNDGSNPSYKCMINNIDKSAMPYPEAAITNIVHGVTEVVNPYQCINFVESVIAGSYGDWWNTWDNAISYKNEAPYVASKPSIRWSFLDINSSTPVEGDIPVFDFGCAYVNGVCEDNGHIAVITKIIDPERKVVDISEANGNLEGGVDTKQVVLPSYSTVGWQHLQ